MFLTSGSIALLPAQPQSDKTYSSAKEVTQTVAKGISSWSRRTPRTGSARSTAP